MTPVEISPVGRFELTALYEISRATFLDTYAHKNEPQNVEIHLRDQLSMDQLGEELKDANTSFYFARMGKEIVGYTKLNTGEAQTEDHYPHALEIERIYVIRSMWKRGIGRQLIEHALEQARMLDRSMVWLGVWTENPEAIAFYTHLGFEPYGTHIFTVGNDPQTDLILGIKL